MAEALDQLRAAGVDLCVIDTPPSAHAFLGTVMRLADLVLLPTRPTTDDLEALPAVLDLVEETGRPFVLVVSQAPPGKSRLHDDALPALAQRGRVAPPLRTSPACGGPTPRSPPPFPTFRTSPPSATSSSTATPPSTTGRCGALRNAACPRCGKPSRSRWAKGEETLMVQRQRRRAARPSRSAAGHGTGGGAGAIRPAPAGAEATG